MSVLSPGLGRLYCYFPRTSSFVERVRPTLHWTPRSRQPCGWATHRTERPRGWRTLTPTIPLSGLSRNLNSSWGETQAGGPWLGRYSSDWAISNMARKSRPTE